MLGMRVHRVEGGRLRLGKVGGIDNLEFGAVEDLKKKGGGDYRIWLVEGGQRGDRVGIEEIEAFEGGGGVGS